MGAGVRDEDEVQVIPAMTHGRIRVRAARAAARRGVLVGFHGYMENLSMQMDRLLAIPGAAAWTLVSVQGLHRVYRGRTEEVVASWMTREDREEAIADNVAYIDTALDTVPHDGSTRIVYTGFSQGVAMAFRAALLGRRHAAGVIAIGGDVPPELLSDPALRFPPLVLARGKRDDWFTAGEVRRGRRLPVGARRLVPSARLRGRPRMERGGVDGGRGVSGRVVAPTAPLASAASARPRPRTGARYSRRRITMSCGMRVWSGRVDSEDGEPTRPVIAHVWVRVKGGVIVRGKMLLPPVAEPVQDAVGGERVELLPQVGEVGVVGLRQRVIEHARTADGEQQDPARADEAPQLAKPRVLVADAQMREDAVAQHQVEPPVFESYRRKPVVGDRGRLQLAR